MDLKLSGFYYLASFPTTDQAFGLCYAMKEQRMFSAGKKVASPKVSPPEIIMISGRRSIGKAGF